jgi:hypothetical protein
MTKPGSLSAVVRIIAMGNDLLHNIASCSKKIIKDRPSSNLITWIDLKHEGIQIIPEIEKGYSQICNLTL